MKIRLNKINKLFIAGTFSLFALIFAACTDSVDEPAPYAVDNGTYLVTGTLSFGTNGGAVSARTATSSFNCNGLVWKIYVYKMDDAAVSEQSETEVQHKEGVSDIPENAKEYTADENGKFSVILDGKGNYGFNAVLKKDDTLCASGIAVLRIGGPITYEVNITLKPVDSGEGSVNLEVSLDSEASAKVTDVRAYVKGSLDSATMDQGGMNHDDPAFIIRQEFLQKIYAGEYNKTFSVSGGKARIVYDNFLSGAYIIKLNFDDSNGNTLYSCEQVINVYPGFTTDTWYGSSSPVSGGQLTVSNSMIEGFGTELVPNFNKLLLWKHAEWNEGNEMKGDFYYLVDENSIGSFTAPTAPTRVVDPEELEAFEAFAQSAEFYSKIGITSSGFDCTFFDAEGNAYLLLISGDAPGEGSGVTSTREDWTHVGNSAISLDDGNELDFTIDLKTNIAYSLKDAGDSFEAYRYLDMVSTNGESAGEPGWIRFNYSLAANCFAVYDGKAYVLCNVGENQYKIAVFEATTGDPHNVIKEYPVNLDSIISDVPGTAMITDMLYQDGCIYLLYKEATVWGTNDTILYSRGAVIEVSLLDGNIRAIGLTQNAIKSTDYKLQGLVDGKAMYEDAEYTTPFIPLITDPRVTNAGVQYPKIYVPAENEKSFYGPTKFVAVKPKKLVISDEGLAFYTYKEVLRYKNVNRVVYVDLETFTIESMVNLDSSVELSGDQTDALFDVNALVDDEIPEYYIKGSEGSVNTTSYYAGIPCGDNE